MKKFCNYEIIYINNDEDKVYYILEDNKKDKYFAKVYNHDYSNETIKNEIDKYNYIKELEFVPKLIKYGENYAIYEYIDGKNLKHIDEFSLCKKLKTFIKVLECVQKVHDLGLVHCDLKINHVLLKNEEIYIIDFDNCSFIGDQIHYGSVVYCSIEQLTKKPVSCFFDYYALAVIFYRLITGTMPYKNKRINDLIIDKKQFPKITDYILNYPKELDQIINKLLSYDLKNLKEVIIEVSQIISVLEE